MALDLRKAQEIIDNHHEKVAGIFPIHPLGYGIPRSDLDKFAKKNKLVLIEDVCESLGSWDKDLHTGTSGLMSSFSFYFSHHMTTMEGGGIATDFDNFADDIKSIRSHGWSRDRSDSSKWSFEIHPSMQKFNFVSTGFNIRPMEIQAAVGREQLRDLQVFVQRRRENVSIVWEAIRGTSLEILGLGIEDKVNARTDHSWMHIPIRISTQGAGAAKLRARLVRFLEDFGIETRPPLTGNFVKQPAMLRYEPEATREIFPIADEISSSVFLVGCHHDLTKEQVNYLAAKLRQASFEIS
jgi:CDP-6-deoxy-D-xylo-4-hexulose-3-dehydrase